MNKFSNGQRVELTHQDWAGVMGTINMPLKQSCGLAGMTYLVTLDRYIRTEYSNVDEVVVHQHFLKESR